MEGKNSQRCERSVINIHFISQENNSVIGIAGAPFPSPLLPPLDVSDFYVYYKLPTSLRITFKYVKHSASTTSTFLTGFYIS